jgi:two-component system CheB/CheR fusion protein
MAQLNVTSDDLQNVFGATTSVMLMVDAELRIRSFSAAAEKLLSLISGDVGRPIAYLRAAVKARDIEQTVSSAINAITATEQKVRLAEGEWYTMRITPYRTGEHVIRGAVLEFVKTVPGEREQAPGELRGLGQAILATLPMGLALLDARMRITWGNEAFLKLFAVAGEDFGRPLEDLWGGRTDQPDLWRLLEDAAVEGRPFQRVVALKGSGQERSVRFSARRLPSDGEQPALTLVIAEEESKEEGRHGL